jgi:adenine-specific DNA methylase
MQLPLDRLSQSERSDDVNRTAPRAIESDDFPFEWLSRIAERESWRKEIYRPIYHVHKWWAQRLGSVFRGILLGALTPQSADVLDLFYSPARFPDAVVFDPFMGSGTTLGETLKLGGRAIGRDINPVSYFQVHTALTLSDTEDLERTYQEIEADVADTISGYYTTRMPDGTLSRVLYYFWVMQAPCPICHVPVDLFSNYIFARHATPRRNPTVHVVCPKCGALSPEHYRVRDTECSECGHRFDATAGPAKGKAVRCPHCLCEFPIGRTIRETGSPPSYRMYAKLVLTGNGEKAYQPINEYDETLYRKAVADLAASPYRIPQGTIEPGYNTNQVLNYGFRSWYQMFNARQLLCIAMLANRINDIDDARIRDAFTCLLSGTLEFNNMFASYKGEGTGAVRHVFNHHILKPERTPLEANVWGTPKSSGAFSTLFRSRLLQAAQYARQPFELALASEGQDKRSMKVEDINDSLLGLSNSQSYDQFIKSARLYLSCGDSSATDLLDESVDLVVTDPPFFDNVHYSQLADFFYCWQRLILEDYPSHQADTTRSTFEVQNSDVTTFTERLTLVLQESAGFSRMTVSWFLLTTTPDGKAGEAYWTQ